MCGRGGRPGVITVENDFDGSCQLGGVLDTENHPVDAQHPAAVDWQPRQDETVDPKTNRKES